MASSASEIGPGDHPSTKQNAIDDATRVQQLVEELCTTNGHDVPPYSLSELIGKGSFGRVYKAFTNTPPRQLVAIKIISIEEGDSSRPGSFDTFRDILHEVNTLKILNESGARNINAIVDTLLVGQSIWVVTEYCAGGSVSTLMKPTKGLAEKWIIPILRETAVALHWIHKQSIIHRDIKCANILVTEDGRVQLCDFGVAGIIDTRVDKRSTVTGTLHWMAPEFFDANVSYGIEVDIWAFGSTAFEMAVGLPPNAVPIVDMADFGTYLRQNPPRLEAEQYSLELKDLISLCMVQDPEARPPIEQIQEHPYLADTERQYPTSSLRTLVQDYRTWETQGGSRMSLFSAGGAQADPRDSPSLTEDWDFGTMRSAYDGQMANDYEPHPEPQQVTGAPTSRRRQMPAKMKPLVTPLERVFKYNTMSNYDDNARAFYMRHTPSSPPELPLRTETRKSDVRESLIDLDAVNGQTFQMASDHRPDQHHPPQEWRSDPGYSDVRVSLIDLDAATEPTFRLVSNDHSAQDRPPTPEWRFPSTSAGDRSSFERTSGELEMQLSTVSFPAAENSRVPMAEWKFPVMHSVRETSRPFAEVDVDSWAQSGQQDTLRPIPVSEDRTDARASALSLIDLDASLLGLGSEATYYDRPSTAMSEPASMSFATSHDDFLHEHQFTRSGREPSIYVSDDIGFQPQALDLAGSIKIVDPPNTIASNLGSAAPDPNDAGERSEGPAVGALFAGAGGRTAPWPDLPPGPSPTVLLANGSADGMKAELLRMVLALKEHLAFTTDVLSTLPVKGSI